MKNKLRCMLLGHDFQNCIRAEIYYNVFKPADNCRYWGLSKRDVNINKR